jgi:hypothetical protein
MSDRPNRTAAIGKPRVLHGDTHLHRVIFGHKGLPVWFGGLARSKRFCFLTYLTAGQGLRGCRTDADAEHTEIMFGYHQTADYTNSGLLARCIFSPNPRMSASL